MENKTVDNLYFEEGLTIHVNRAVDGWFYASAFGKEIKGGKYNKSECKKGFGYGTPSSLNLKIENSGTYNINYWSTIKSMINQIEMISKKKLIKKSYYSGG